MIEHGERLDRERALGRGHARLPSAIPSTAPSRPRSRTSRPASAVELGRHGIRVNGIGPDLTQTPQVDYIAGTEGSEQLWEVVGARRPPRRPEDQARVALFLASRPLGLRDRPQHPGRRRHAAGGGWFWSPERRRFVNRPKTL